MPVVLAIAALGAAGVGAWFFLRPHPTGTAGGAPSNARPAAQQPSTPTVPASSGPPVPHLQPQTGSVDSQIATDVLGGVKGGVIGLIDGATKAAGDLAASVATTQEGKSAAYVAAGVATTGIGIAAAVYGVSTFAGPVGLAVATAAVDVVLIVSQLVDAIAGLEKFAQSRGVMQKIQDLTAQGLCLEAWAVFKEMSAKGIPGLSMDLNPPVFGDGDKLRFTNGGVASATDLLTQAYAAAWRAYNLDASTGFTSNVHQLSAEATASRELGDAWANAIGYTYVQDPTSKQMVISPGWCPWVSAVNVQLKFGPPRDKMASRSQQQTARAVSAAATGRQAAQPGRPASNGTTPQSSSSGTGGQHTQSSSSPPNQNQGSSHTGGATKPGKDNR